MPVYKAILLDIGWFSIPIRPLHSPQSHSCRMQGCPLANRWRLLAYICCERTLQKVNNSLRLNGNVDEQNAAAQPQLRIWAKKTSDWQVPCACHLFYG